LGQHTGTSGRITPSSPSEGAKGPAKFAEHQSPLCGKRKTNTGSEQEKNIEDKGGQNKLKNTDGQDRRQDLHRRVGEEKKDGKTRQSQT